MRQTDRCLTPSPQPRRSLCYNDCVTSVPQTAMPCARRRLQACLSLIRYRLPHRRRGDGAVASASHAASRVTTYPGRRPLGRRALTWRGMLRAQPYSRGITQSEPKQQGQRSRAIRRMPRGWPCIAFVARRAALTESLRRALSCRRYPAARHSTCVRSHVPDRRHCCDAVAGAAARARR